ncbi:MAG TPA: hypothetical protein VK989_06965 [Polyangia bacterium]|jgi:hypothetical protein|nr:hypothetical protein [Polyangia bacterium]
MSAHRRARRPGVSGTIARRSLVSVIVVVILSLCAGRSALAFVRYKTSNGSLYYWPQTCVPLSAYPDSLTAANGNMELSSAEVMNAVTLAAAQWGADSNACTFVRLNVTQQAGAPAATRLDYVNQVLFRTTGWSCPSGMAGPGCYDAMALAITSVYVDTSTGKIKDADIEINAQGFSWADLVTDPALVGSSQDLQNALTHEMGHLIGLDHTCYIAGSVTTPPIDNSGQPIPDCDDATETVRETTMAAVALRGDVGKRMLKADDIAGVCDIYPVAMNPMTCPAKDVAPPTMEACRCDAGGARGRSTGLAAGLLALAALVRRRRESRRR